MRALLFDLDGTLLDSGPDLADAVNAARAGLGAEPLALDAVLPHIGWGLTHLLAHTLPEAVGRDDVALSAARETFHRWYRAHVYDRSRPYAGADAVLDAWSGRCGLVTNKPRDYVLEILERAGWTDHLAAVVCGDIVRKPAPEPLWRALETLDVAPADALFVGDSEVDRDAALAAGVPFAAVPWGRVTGTRTTTLTALAALASGGRGDHMTASAKEVP